MKVLKKWLNRIFIDGLTGMAQGLFATLIVGTIIQQIGSLIGGNVGDAPTAAQAWINYKNRTITNAKSYVVMYNPRGKHDNGVPYPGLETAYKKPTVSTTINGEPGQKVSGASWTGGNRAYAGLGMYVIVGDEKDAGGHSRPLRISIEVAGIWRIRNTNGVIDASPQLISENSIKFNLPKFTALYFIKTQK